MYRPEPRSNDWRARQGRNFVAFMWSFRQTEPPLEPHAWLQDDPLHLIMSPALAAVGRPADLLHERLDEFALLPTSPSLTHSLTH